MTSLSTRAFGLLQTAPDGAYVPREADERGRTLRPSLFLAEDLAQADLDQVAPLIDDAAVLDMRARAAIVADLEKGEQGVVAAFVAFHLEELDAATVHLLFDGIDVSQPEAALARLELVGFGVHGGSASPLSIVFDYSFGKTHTDELLAVAFSADREVQSIRHES